MKTCKIPAAVERRVTAIVLAVSEGDSPLAYGGKKMVFDGNVYSVPVSYDYRLLFIKKHKGGFRSAGLVTHETYNGLVNAKRRSLETSGEEMLRKLGS